jgi:hypothetical protein
MRMHDYLIGGITAALGLIALWHAFLGRERLMHLAKFRVLVDAVGFQVAGWLVAALGGVLLTVGALLVSGFRFPWQ